MGKPLNIKNSADSCVIVGTFSVNDASLAEEDVGSGLSLGTGAVEEWSVEEDNDVTGTVRGVEIDAGDSVGFNDL